MPRLQAVEAMYETGGVSRHAPSALVVLLMVLASACGSGTGGGGTGGKGTGSGGTGGAAGQATGGSGGALAGAGGHATGGAGGALAGAGGHPTGGAGGALAGAGGHPTGGALAGAGGHPTGGAGGFAGAAGGVGTGGYFSCFGTVTQSNPCSPPGVVCNEASESVQFCYCRSNGTWGCGGPGPCGMAPGDPCTNPSDVAALGGCKIPPSTLCTCQPSADGGNTYICQNNACPVTQPTGTCAVQTTLVCGYQAKAVSCDCEADDAGVRRWKCNGHPTPDCPTSPPGNGATCSAYQPGAVCSYAAGPCTCNANGSSQTWSCG